MFQEHPQAGDEKGHDFVHDDSENEYPPLLDAKEATQSWSERPSIIRFFEELGYDLDRKERYTGDKKETTAIVLVPHKSNNGSFLVVKLFGVPPESYVKKDLSIQRIQGELASYQHLEGINHVVQPLLIQDTTAYENGVDPVIIMQGWNTGSLENFSNRFVIDPMPFDLLYRCISQAGSALVEMHKRGFSPRDVSANNLLVNVSGDEVNFAWHDFGISSEVMSRLSEKDFEEMVAYGTLSFVHPFEMADIIQKKEKLRYRFERRDMFGFATIVYYLLSRSKFPFGIAQEDPKGFVRNQQMGTQPLESGFPPTTYYGYVVGRRFAPLPIIPGSLPGWKPEEIAEITAILRRALVPQDEEYSEAYSTMEEFFTDLMNFFNRLRNS